MTVSAMTGAEAIGSCAMLQRCRGRQNYAPIAQMTSASDRVGDSLFEGRVRDDVIRHRPNRTTSLM
jgi:hypothetical protein